MTSNHDDNAPVIRPIDIGVDDPSGANGPEPARPRRSVVPARRTLGLAAGAVALVVGLVAVFVWLPEQTRAPAGADGAADAAQGRTAEAGPAAPSGSRAAAPVVDTNDEAVIAARREAQEARRRAEAGIAALTERAVEVWAPAEIARVKEAMGLGEAAYRELAYRDARDAYTRAADGVDALESEAEAAFDRYLAAGESALDTGDAEAARTAFETALRIVEGDERASAGLARAKRLPEVLAAMARGSTAEADGALEDALAAYREAADIDPEFTRAAERVDVLEAELAERDFKRAMARGYEAFGRGDLSGARQAFEAARRIRPEAPEVAEALADVAGDARAERVRALKDDIARAERSEDWPGALKAYAALAELKVADPGLARARDRAERQAALDAELAELAGDPGQLATEAGRDRLARLKSEARDLGPSGPGRARTLARLVEIETVMTTPVPVTLTSDGKTRVTVYRHGRLGTFERTSIALTPGRWVAVGAREGYRDVRVAFVVDPDDPSLSIDVRCEDPIMASRG